MQWGVSPVISVPAGGAGSTTITFPIAYTQTPIVTVTGTSGTSNTYRASNITLTNFALGIQNTTQAHHQVTCNYISLLN